MAHYIAVSVADYVADEQEWLSNGFVPLGVVNAKSEDDAVALYLVRDFNVKRQCVRVLAEKHNKRIRDTATIGGNAHQAKLDFIDEAEAFSSKLSKENAAKFMAIYSEEMSACGIKSEEDEIKISKELATKIEIQSGLWVWCGYALVSFICFYFIFN